MENPKSCKYHGEEFPSGEELCFPDHCMVCREGKWVDEGMT